MKFTKRIFAALLATAAIFCLGSIAVSAEVSTVTLRIEGITENLYYSEIELGDSTTVADVIIAADTASDDISIIGADVSYITAVNDDIAGKFGGWDGWMYRVNNIEPSVGIGDYIVKAGDIIVLYYNDAYGVGMQYPEINTSDIANGVIRFTSKDTTYDENFDAIVSENPVANMTVIIDETEYVTDADGKITVDTELLTAGEHTIKVSKVSDAGIPMVLRLAPDATVSVPEPTHDDPATDSKPGDDSSMVFFVVVAILALAGSVIIVKERK